MELFLLGKGRKGGLLEKGGGCLEETREMTFCTVLFLHTDGKTRKESVLNENTQTCKEGTDRRRLVAVGRRRRRLRPVADRQPLRHRQGRPGGGAAWSHHDPHRRRRAAGAGDQSPGPVPFPGSGAQQ